MPPETTPTTTTISVFTRHNLKCTKKDDPQWKRCKCPKSLYIYENSKKGYKSAKTRSWEKAENLANEEREARDPSKKKLREIAEEEAARKAEQEAVQAAKNIALKDALARWTAGMKRQSKETRDAYQTFVRKMLKWSESKKVANLQDVKPEMLDEWRSSWSPTAELKENRLALKTQSHLLTKIRSFFRWAAAIELIYKDPSLLLESIESDHHITMPLTPEQFKQVMAATEEYDADRRRAMDRFGPEFRAIFLLQRWAGLRLVDALKFARSGLKGNRLHLKTQKTGAEVECTLPDIAVEALHAVPRRKGVHPDCYFWTRRCTHRVLSGMWDARIKRLNEHLSFVDEEGKPLGFHSHMLRDTFAVELLLAGVPLERVSRLLTHTSVRVTEKYYARWVKSRRQQLDNETIEAMRKMGVTVTVPENQYPELPRQT